jgi:hypothetical protein
MNRNVSYPDRIRTPVPRQPRGLVTILTELSLFQCLGVRASGLWLRRDLLVQDCADVGKVLLDQTAMRQYASTAAIGQLVADWMPGLAVGWQC